MHLVLFSLSFIFIIIIFGGCFQPSVLAKPDGIQDCLFSSTITTALLGDIFSSISIARRQNKLDYYTLFVYLHTIVVTVIYVK